MLPASVAGLFLGQTTRTGGHLPGFTTMTVYRTQMCLKKIEYISMVKYKTLTFRGQILMPNVSLDGLNFSDLA